MDCCAFCNASAYKLKALVDALRPKYKTEMMRDVAHVEIPIEGQENADLFFFPYGAMVGWGLNKEQGLQYLKLVDDYATQKTDEVETDEFTYIRGDVMKVTEDEISLPYLDKFNKLAVSHAIAQSVKLGAFELAIHNTFLLTRQIPEELAKHGKIFLSRREIRRKMGELFIERNSINLHLDVLDTPEFFWDHPELEPEYKMMANYLDIGNRVEVLNQRLSIVRELFEMMGNELNHQHSSRLEWIIICLIVIEVLLTLLKDVFGIL